MKFLARNLLLAIVFYFNFRESTSSGIYRGGSSGPSSSYHNPSGDIPPVLLRYNKKVITVSYYLRNGHPTPHDCRVGGEHDGIPNLETKKNINFITRALIHDGIRYCVVYEKEDGVVLGAKLPPPDDQQYTGNPYDFNPIESICYMTYKGLDFKVTKVPHEEIPLKIELLPINKSNPSQSYIHSYDVRPVYVHFGGLYFVMHQRHRTNGKDSIKIVGADLDLEGPQRPAEIYSG